MSSPSSGYDVYVRVDTAQLQRQLKQYETMFENASKKITRSPILSGIGGGSAGSRGNPTVTKLLKVQEDIAAFQRKSYADQARREFKQMETLSKEVRELHMKVGKLNSGVSTGSNVKKVLPQGSGGAPLTTAVEKPQQPTTTSIGVSYGDKTPAGILGRLTSAIGRMPEILGRLSIGGAGGNKMTGMLGQLVGGLSKNTLAMVGIGAGVGALVGLMVESSPILKSVLRIMSTGVMLMLRPIADFIGSLLRPIMVMILQKFIIPYYQYVDPIMRKLGAEFGANIAGFFKDPLKALKGLAVNILNWPGQPSGGGGGGTTIGGGSGPADAAGTAQQQSHLFNVALNETVKVADSAQQMSGLLNSSAKKAVSINDSMSVADGQFQNTAQKAADIATTNQAMSQTWGNTAGVTAGTMANVKSKSDDINDSMQKAQGNFEPVPLLAASMNLLLAQGKNVLNPLPDHASTISDTLQRAGTNINPAPGYATDITGLMQQAKNNALQGPGYVENVSDSMKQARDKAAPTPSVMDSIIGFFNSANTKVQQWFNGLALPAIPGLNAPVIPAVAGYQGGGSSSTSSISTGFTSYNNSAIAAISNALSSGHNVTGFGATGGVFAGATGQSYAATRMAKGGLITEHIFGIGKSGRRYEFGESGEEAVVPLGSGGGGAGNPSSPRRSRAIDTSQPTTIQFGDINIQIVGSSLSRNDATELANQLKPKFMEWVQQALKNSKSKAGRV